MKNANRPLQVIKEGRYFMVVISELTLDKYDRNYDFGWCGTYAQNKLEYYENNPEELLKRIDTLRKDNKIEGTVYTDDHYTKLVCKYTYRM